MKERRMIRLRALCLLFVLSMAVGVLAACGKKGDDGTKTDPASDPGTTDPNETDEWGQNRYDDVVPKLDYGATTVNILMREKGAEDPRRYEWYVDKIESGDELSEKIWFRNQEIEEQLNVKLKFTQRVGDPGNDMLTPMIVNAFTGGGDGVDIISHYHYYATSLATMECYKNVMHPDLTYLHLNNPYWNQNFIRYATSQDRLFVLQGDMNLSTFMTTFVMFFQKDLLRSMCATEAADLYETVLDGKWTIDKLIEMCTDVAVLDSEDGDSAGDIYAFTSHYNVHAYDGFLAAFNMDLTQTDEEGKHSLVGSTAQRKIQQAADKLVNFYRSDDVYLVGRGVTEYTTPVAAFRQNRSIFCVAGLGDYTHLSEMKIDSWGLLPMPKYEARQDSYYAGVQDSHNTVAVMYGSDKNYEMISAVLELFASKSYASVRPVLFNRVIKGQKLQDPQSLKVFDLIMNSTRWDFADIYPTAVQNVRNTLWRDALRGAVYGDGDGSAAVLGAFVINKDPMNKAFEKLDDWLYTHY